MDKVVEAAQPLGTSIYIYLNGRARSRIEKEYSVVCWKEFVPPGEIFVYFGWQASSREL